MAAAAPSNALVSEQKHFIGVPESLGYVAGVERGDDRHTPPNKRQKVQLKVKEEEDEDSDDSNYCEFVGYGGSQFSKGPYEKAATYNAIDNRMDEKIKENRYTFVPDSASSKNGFSGNWWSYRDPSQQGYDGGLPTYQVPPNMFGGTTTGQATSSVDLDFQKNGRIRYAPMDINLNQRYGGGSIPPYQNPLNILRDIMTPGVATSSAHLGSRKIDQPRNALIDIKLNAGITLEEAKLKAEEWKQYEKFLKKQEMDAKKFKQEQRKMYSKFKKEIDKNKAKEDRKRIKERLLLEKKEAEKQKQIKKIEEKIQKQRSLELNTKLEKEIVKNKTLEEIKKMKERLRLEKKETEKRMTKIALKMQKQKILELNTKHEKKKLLQEAEEKETAIFKNEKGYDRGWQIQAPYAGTNTPGDITTPGCSHWNVDLGSRKIGEDRNNPMIIKLNRGYDRGWQTQAPYAGTNTPGDITTPGCAHWNVDLGSRKIGEDRNNPMVIKLNREYGGDWQVLSPYPGTNIPRGLIPNWAIPNEYLDLGKKDEARNALINKEPNQTSESIWRSTGETDFDSKTNYEDLLAALDASLVSNVEPFECPICFVNIDKGEGVILHDCLHSFCKDCLAGLIQHSDTATIKCPFQNDDYACEFFLQDREIKNLVSTEIYEKHLRKSLTLAESQAPNSFHCKTSDCPGWCLYEDDVNIFRCPACTKTNCLTCAAIHEGQNCKQYQDFVELNSATNEDAKATNQYLQSMLNDEKAMKCPKCFIIIMKKDGCDAVTCSMCKTEICWVTKGARWGPMGKGDISGGCRCNFNGKRCHPNCRNCH